MLNILSLSCICLNYVFYSSSFFLAKLPEAYAFSNPIVDIMPVIPVFFFISFCVASCCMFSMSFCGASYI